MRDLGCYGWESQGRGCNKCAGARESQANFGPTVSDHKGKDATSGTNMKVSWEIFDPMMRTRKGVCNYSG